MSGYRELREGYQLNVKNTNSTGTKVFIDDADGSYSLPSIGDPFDVYHLNIICNEITKEVYHVNHADACHNGYKYTCKYSDDDGLASTNRRLSAGGEMISVNNKPGEAGVWYWTDTPTQEQINTCTDRCVQKIYKRTVVGTFSRSIDVSTSEFQEYSTDNMFPKLGTINATPFEKEDYTIFPIGTLLFNTVDATLITDSGGSSKWVVTLNFAYRFIPDLGDASTVTDTWQYLWRADTSGDYSEGAFQVPIKKISSVALFEGMLYQYSELNDLYQTEPPYDESSSGI